MKSALKNKKGNVFQILFLLIIVFTAAVATLVCGSLSWHIDTYYQMAPGYNDSVVGQKVSNFTTNQSPTIGDELIFFLFIGGIIGLMVGAIRTNYSPAILFLFILVSFISVLVASGLVNLYQGFAQAPGLVEIADKFTLTNVIFSRYTPLFTCIICAIILILMYAKSGADISI